MSLLRILRNLAVLAILAMAVLASPPRPAVAAEGGWKELCLPQGFRCPARFHHSKQILNCCNGLICTGTPLGPKCMLLRF